jgi:TPP-dependent indolepyruvate ferredoxin oxidoreductase alpha subunit
LGIGLCEANVSYPFCVSGDASLAHAGVQVIEEAHARKVDMGVIIVENGGSWSTGGQMPLSGISFCSLDIPIHKVFYNDFTQNDFFNLFQEMKKTNLLTIVRVIVS